jgi:hypothetical protein
VDHLDRLFTASCDLNVDAFGAEHAGASLSKGPIVINDQSSHFLGDRIVRRALVGSCAKVFSGQGACHFFPVGEFNVDKVDVQYFVMNGHKDTKPAEFGKSGFAIIRKVRWQGNNTINSI